MSSSVPQRAPGRHRMHPGRAVTLLALIAVALIPGKAAVPQPSGTGLDLDPADRASLASALAPLHRQYDPAERMIRRPFSSPGYHTTLTGGEVHPTRDSLGYALACLDTGDAALAERATAVLQRVVALQDTDPASRTYGIWSWFLEEPLERMAPPDWNWADFCGALLLQAVRDHGARLPETLRLEVDRAVQHAARSIQKRNVGPDYTNIAMMGTYVTLVAAERYGLSDLLDYARARLRRLHDHITRQGAFTEYNSPTYTIVALKELARMRQDFSRPGDLALVEPLYRLAWEEIATHFHQPTRQWAGPHSRCYRTLLGNEVPALIQRATNGRVDFGITAPSLDAHRLRAPCPPAFEPFFRDARTASIVRTFIPGSEPVVGTTWMTPQFALSSVNRGDLWNQRRPLLAYWGTASAPSFLRLRLLRDGYDFAAAQFFSVQDQGRVLAALNIATDGGQTHVSLDRMKDGTFEAADLRVRFELGGEARHLPVTPPPTPDAPLAVTAGPAGITLAVPFARFGGPPLRWEVERGDDCLNLDLVLTSGPRRAIRLAEAGLCGVGLAVAIRRPGLEVPAVRADQTGDELRLTWEGLSVEIALRPARAAELRRRAVLHAAAPLP